ncbi:Lysine-specific permease [compost metagenome]
MGIAVSHYRFRKGFIAQGGNLQDLPYRAKWFPFGPLFAFALCLFITLGQNYSALLGERIDWGGLVATYISLPLFLAIWLGYRFKHRCRLVKLSEMDVGGLRADEAPSARQLLEVPIGAQLDMKQR